MIVFVVIVSAWTLVCIGCLLKANDDESEKIWGGASLVALGALWVAIGSYYAMRPPSAPEAPPMQGKAVPAQTIQPEK